MAVPTEGQGDEEGVSLDVQGIHSNLCHSFFTILDNVLTVGESAGGKEQAARPHPHLRGLLEGSAGGARNSAAADFAEALLR
jgi:hypothetical protein